MKIFRKLNVCDVRAHHSSGVPPAIPDSFMRKGNLSQRARSFPIISQGPLQRAGLFRSMCYGSPIPYSLPDTPLNPPLLRGRWIVPDQQLLASPPWRRG